MAGGGREDGGDRQGVSNGVPPDDGRGNEAQRWPNGGGSPRGSSGPGGSRRRWRPLGRRQFPLAPVAIGAAAEDGGVIAPVGASGPTGCGGIGWRRLPSAPAALGATTGRRRLSSAPTAQDNGSLSTVNPMKWKPIPSVRIWLASSG
uniref:Uncharacterized protein n=1 Tax=Oryza barthii TaxID=65489 RepID=A0A0D3GLC9_9ORYZ